MEAVIRRRRHELDTQGLIPRPQVKREGAKLAGAPTYPQRVAEPASRLREPTTVMHPGRVPTLTPGERISLIRESATLLDKQEWDEIDLVLEQHGLPTSDFDIPNTKSAYIMKMIKNSSNQSLAELHKYLIDEAASSPVVNSPWPGNRLRLFCSHLAQHKHVVGQVGDGLAVYGVEPFIAHDSIEPSLEWAAVIEAALADCDAMIVFLHPGFHESRWCDQEVGWALGRKRPILPLGYGVNPYGFIGKLQAQPAAHASPMRAAQFIMDWLTKTPSLHGRLVHGLVDAFVKSTSWNFTRSVVPLLDRIHSVTDDDLTRMEQAARENIDVRDCAIPPGLSGPEWVAAFVGKRRGSVSPATWSESDEPPF